MASLYDTRFIILDTETTGNNTATDKPIEIAAVEWQAGAPGKLLTWHVDPKLAIKPSAMAVHHLTAKSIEGAPSLEEVLPDITAFVGSSPLVIHNSAFDLAMLPSFMEHPTICSLRMARHLWSKGEKNKDGFELTNHQAQTIRYWLDLDVDTGGLAAHRAGADILVCGNIFQVAMDQYLASNHEDDLQSLIDFVKGPIDYKVMPYGRQQGLPFSQVEDKYVSYYLDQKRNPNPDPDVLVLMRAERVRRICEERALRDLLPSNVAAAGAASRMSI